MTYKEMVLERAAARQKRMDVEHVGRGTYRKRAKVREWLGLDPVDLTRDETTPPPSIRMKL